MVDWPLTSPLNELMTDCRFSSITTACTTLSTLRSIAPRLQITGLVIKRISSIVHGSSTLFAQWCEDIRRERRVYNDWDDVYTHLKIFWLARHNERMTITKLLNENPSLSMKNDRKKSNFALSASVVDQSGLPVYQSLYSALFLLNNPKKLEKYQNSSASSSRKSRSSSRNELARTLKYAAKDTRRADEHSMITILHKLMDRRVKVLTNKDIGEMLFLVMQICPSYYPLHLTTSITPSALLLLLLKGISVGSLPCADPNVLIQSWIPAAFTTVYQLLLFVGLQARRYWNSKLAIVSWLKVHSAVIHARAGEKGVSEVCAGCSKQAATVISASQQNQNHFIYKESSKLYKLADQLWIESSAGEYTSHCLALLSSKAKSLHKRVHPAADITAAYSYSLQSLVAGIIPIYSAANILRQRHCSMLATYLASNEFTCFGKTLIQVGASEIDQLLGPFTIPMENDTAESIIAILSTFSNEGKKFNSMHALIAAVHSHPSLRPIDVQPVVKEVIATPLISTIPSSSDPIKINNDSVVSSSSTLVDNSFLPSALAVFIVGPPGSGKSIHCSRIATKFDYIHLQFDPFFYWAVKYAVDAVLSKSRSVSRRNSMNSNILLASAASEPRNYLPLKNPNLAFDHMLTNAELKALYLCYDDALPIPSYIRARILFAAMHHIHKHTGNAKFLIDGWLEDEDDWTEWVAISEATLTEEDKTIVDLERTRNGIKFSSVSEGIPRKLNFLPPLIIRLVCSEKIGMSRWQQVSATSKDFKSMISSVELRRNQYSLRTRPLLYKLGVTLKEMNRRKRSLSKGTPDTEPSSSEALLSFPGMYVKRINAEVSEDAVSYSLTQVFQKLSRTYNPSEDAINFEVIEDEDEVLIHLPIVVTPVSPAAAETSTEVSNKSTNKLNVLIPPRTIADLQDTITASPSLSHINFTHDDDDIVDDDEKEIEHKYYDDDDDDEDVDVPDEKIDDAALISPQVLEIEKHEEAKKIKDEAEINRLKNEVEEVVAASGQIATRRDDRFTTFISFSLSCSTIHFPTQKSSLFGSAPIPSMLIDICRYEAERFDNPWISVFRTQISSVTPSVLLGRALANTWKLCGNERERPILFRLWNYTNPSQPVIAAAAQTSLVHILNPPSEAGLVIPFMVSDHIPPVSNGFLIISAPKLHVLLKANRVVDPKTLQSILPSHRQMTTLKNVVDAVESAHNTPTEQSAINSPQQLSPALSPHAVALNSDNSAFAETKENMELPALALALSPVSNSSQSSIPLPTTTSPKAEEKSKEILASSKHQARARKLERNIIHKRATSRERRRQVLSELRKQKSVKSVSWVQFKTACHSLPNQTRWDKGNEEVYLCVFKRRNVQSEKNKSKRRAQIRLKAERDLAKKLQDSNRGPSELTFQLKLLKDKWKKEDELEAFTLESSNWCIKKSHRGFIPSSKYSLIYKSEAHSTSSDRESVPQQIFPNLAPFVLPVDKHPLIFVLISKGCHHERDNERERGKLGAEGISHNGKDRIIGMVQLDMRDMLRISGIMSLNWDIDVYKEVEEERERAREHRRRMERGESVPPFMASPIVEDTDRNMVTVRLHNPKDIAEKKKKSSTETRNRTISNSEQHPDLDQNDMDSMSAAEEAAEESAKKASGCLSFFSIAFFSEKQISQDAMIADYDPPSSGKHRTHRSNTNPNLGATTNSIPDTRPRHTSMPAPLPVPVRLID